MFGDGISLKFFDLKKFNDKIAIGCCILPFHKDFDCLKCSYMVVVEPYWFFPIIRTYREEKKVIINKIQTEYRKTIARYQDKEFFLNLSNCPVTWAKNITYVFRDIFDSRLRDDFITKKINCFHGTMRTQILLAIYMGFEEAVLIGHDYTHAPSRNLHFYEKGRGVDNNLLRWNEEFFNLAKRFINIKTITVDAKSETLNYMTYKEYTGLEPVYKENNEIVDEKYLRVLSTWPWYSIY